MAIDPVWIAFAGTLCGGIGLKVAEHWLGRNKVKQDDATQIRDELRQEITTLRAEMLQAEKDVDKWREEYYKLYEKFIAEQTEAKIALEKIKNELAMAQANISQVSLVRNPPPAQPPLPPSNTVGP